MMAAAEGVGPMMVPTGVAEAYDGPRRGKRGREVDDHDVVLVRRGLESWETGVLAGGNLKRESEKGGGEGVVAEFLAQD